MKKVIAVLAVLLAAGWPSAGADGTKLPVLTLRYSAGLGAEELEEEAEGIEPASVRHSASLRIKEELGPSLATALTLFYSTKDYFEEPGDYTYFYLKPELAWDLSDRIALETQFRSKWVGYDRPDVFGDSKDYASLSGGFGLSYRPARSTRISGTLKAGWDLHKNHEKSEQLYSAGLRVLARLRSVSVGASCGGTFYAPLGSSSAQNPRVAGELGTSLTWDPNE